MLACSSRFTGRSVAAAPSCDQNLSARCECRVNRRDPPALGGFPSSLKSESSRNDTTGVQSSVGVEVRLQLCANPMRTQAARVRTIWAILFIRPRIVTLSEAVNRWRLST